MQRTFFMTLALLCAMVQGTWAADRNYEYPTKTKPQFYASYGGKSNVVVINTPAELAYITAHFSEDSGFAVENDDWSELNYYLNADIDMGTTYSWLPLGRESYWVTKYEGTFWGNGHTIKYKIWGLDEENQGLFSTINQSGKVYDVNVICDINTERDWVGGIAGESYGLIQNCTVNAKIVSKDHDEVGGIVGWNRAYGKILDCRVSGTIKGLGSAQSIGGIAGQNLWATGDDLAKIYNCWVSADVSSEHYNAVTDAYVGGIVGLNKAAAEYCCMSGNVSNPRNSKVGGLFGSSSVSTSHSKGKSAHTYAEGNHGTFYGTIYNDHSRSSNSIGKGAGYKISESFDQSEYDEAKAKGYDLYCYALKYPFAINVTIQGFGTCEVSAGGETGITRWRPGQTVTLTQKTGTVESITIKDANGNNIELQGQSADTYSYWFVMPKRDVSITVVSTKPAWLNHAGTKTDPYTIGNTTEWNELAHYVNGGYNFRGKFVKLTNDISVSAMVGMDDANSFQGTFDGNGKKLTVNYNTSEAWTAPFRHVKNATIKNLHVAGTITTSAKCAGGIVAESHGALNITNCRSSVAINSSVNGDGTHGGFVATLSGADNAISIIGCVFDGSFATTNGTTDCGGFIGWPVYNKPTIENSLMKPTSVATGMLNNTFARWHSNFTPIIKNSYFAATDNLPTDQGTQARKVTGSEGVNVSVLGLHYYTTATYSVSGIEACVRGIYCNGTCYYGNGDMVGVSLSNSVPTEDGTTIQYTASAGTLNGTTLTMPDSDVIIGYNIVTADLNEGHTGEANDPYLIYTKEQFELLRQHATNQTYHRYYKLMNDIVYEHETDWDDATSTENNFEPISLFNGDLDGNGHTISGIRIYSGGNSKNQTGDSNKALFGVVLQTQGNFGTKIHDLTLADTRITGYWMVGAIVGDNQGATIERCNVTSTVAIHSVQDGANAHGGIVGWNSNGSINNCTSAATLTATNANEVTSFGAICGYNQSLGKLTGNLAVGATVPQVKDNKHGAICGRNGGETSSHTNNYYISCTVAGTSNATGVGTNGTDIEENHGALPAYSITEGSAEKFSIAFDEDVISSDDNITFYDEGFMYNNVLYAPAGKEVSLTLTNTSDLDAIYKVSAGTLTGTENPYMLTMPAQDVSISITGLQLNGSGTEDAPYIISSEDDWVQFATNVNSGAVNGYKNQYVKLTADITVTTMAGKDPDHTFRGIFDGDGHTLTVNYTTDEQYAAPFHYTYGCTIKNLKTAGTINTSNINAGGVVGRNGTASITLENVSSSVTINSSFSGSAYHGGLIGYTINASLTGCAFTGRLLGTESHHIGGLLGQKSNTGSSNASFTNCLFAPAEIDIHPGMSHTFASGADAVVTIGNDCYYTTPMGSAQGIQVYTTAIEGEINKQVTPADGNTYYMPCSVSGVQEGYKYNDGSDITITPPTITAADGMVLTSDDFTFSPATVNETGEYKLTVTGTGNYIGSKQFDIIVGEYLPVTSTTTTMESESYKVYNDVTINERIIINGEVDLYLGEGTTLRAKKGIELSEGNGLTIYGPGALNIDKCDANKSGIGATTAGLLTIRGGQIDITGAEGAAGIGSDAGEAASGDLTLSWADGDDYVKCGSYSLRSDILFSKQFVIDDEQIIANNTNVSGKRIVPAVVIANNDDNSATLEASDDNVVAAVLKDRTLYLDGNWNTICLPFDYPISDLKDTEARTLTNANIAGSTLNITFGSPVDTLKAGTPYIVKFAKADDYVDDDAHNFLNPVFYYVVIDATANHDYDNGVSGDKRVRFLGTYNAMTFTDDNQYNILLIEGDTNNRNMQMARDANSSIRKIAGDTTLRYVGEGSSISACQAYFKIGDDDNLPTSQLTGFNIYFGELDGINAVSSDIPAKGRYTDNNWYSIDGRKLQGKPNVKGVYINGKHKVVIK